MSIIEQATKRLEQLRQAGVDVPWREAPGGVEPRAGVTSTPPAANDRPPAEVRPAAPAVARSSRSISLDLPLLAKTMLVPGHELMELAAEFRAIKRPIVANIMSGDSSAARAGSNVIVVTSAVQGEGKTFCAINLALSLAAEVDRTVLLVDADILKPSVGARLGIDSRRGLLDLLADHSLDVSEVLLKTNVPKLTVLPAGVPRPDSAELVAGGHMKGLFDELSRRYADRIIVVDAPPLLPTSEARTLADRAGQVVMVVDAGGTLQSHVEQAFAALEACPNVMSVLNRRSSLLRNYGAAYGYAE